jgi:hypothetical protein
MLTDLDFADVQEQLENRTAERDALRQQLATVTAELVATNDYIHKLQAQSLETMHTIHKEATPPADAVLSDPRVQKLVEACQPVAVAASNTWLHNYAPFTDLGRTNCDVRLSLIELKAIRDALAPFTKEQP